MKEELERLLYSIDKRQTHADKQSKYYQGYSDACLEISVEVANRIEKEENKDE